MAQIPPRSPPGFAIPVPPMLTLENSPGLAAILVKEAVDGATDLQFVKWAQDALEQGHDSPSLLRLAIQEPPFFIPDLRRLFKSATDDIGLETVSFEQARVYLAQELAKRLTSASVPARTLAEQLAQVFPSHSTSPPFDVWWQLEEAFTCDYCRDGVELRGKALEDAILEELDNLLCFNWRTA